MYNQFGVRVLFFVVIVPTVCAKFDYPKIPVDSIDTTKLEFVRHKKTWYVFRDGVAHLYYKIDPKCLPNSHAFLSALQAGFFRDLTSLEALVVKGERLVGYVTREGVSAKHTSDIAFQATVLSNRIIFSSLSEQRSAAYKRFYDKLLRATKKHGFFFADFIPGNLIMIDGEYKLIDLESVSSMQSLCDSPLRVLQFVSNPSYPAEYKRAILDMVYRRLSRNMALDRAFYGVACKKLKQSSAVKAKLDYGVRI